MVLLFFKKTLKFWCSLERLRPLLRGGRKMDNQKFINRCIAIVQQRIENEYSDSSGACPYFDVFVVWSCKTLQNNKAILSATLKGAPLFEITHNGDKNEMYVDTYTKKSNECIKV